LQELERQKKALKQGQSASGPDSTLSSTAGLGLGGLGGGLSGLGSGVGVPPPPGGRPATAEMHLLSANQRAALDMANKTAFGFFITQGI